MSSQQRAPPKVVIVPGNGSGDIEDCNWYGWLKQQLVAAGIDVQLRNMPDPVRARQSIWLPFMTDKLKCDEATIIVGHSSGAAAAMRLSETHKVLGLVLVGAYKSDLGDATEAASGYFDRPWLWGAIKANTRFIVQFASRDDPFLPWAEQAAVAEAAGAELHAYDDAGHFQDEEQPDLLRAVLERVKQHRQ